MAKKLRKITFLLTITAFLGLQSCVVSTKTTAIVPEIRSLFEGTYKVDPYMEEHRPVTVAVLPFLDQSKSKEGAVAVRKGFYNHFSSMPFKDMEIQRVDSLLWKAGLTDTAEIYKTSPQDLGKILNVDAVIYGEISNFDKLFAVIYSQVAVGAEIKMYDTKTGNFLWSGQHTVRIHEGGISTTPIGLIATVIATSMNLRDIQLLRACDDLFREMVKTIPAPSVAEALRPPVITLLTQDTKGAPKKAGDEIRVVIQGTPKMQAYFDIGDYKKRLDMQEVEPGGYIATYRVLPGDNVSQAVVTGYLRDEAGNVAQWVDAVGYVTLDTTPPEKIVKLRSVGRNNLVLMSWDKSSAADLAGYRIYRSDTPLTGFQEAARSEFNEWRDEKVVNGSKYYYYATAVDLAGNESEKSDTLMGMPVAPGPTPVSGAIETDTSWYAGAGPYIIEQAVTVKDKATLTIEPGTEVRSKGAALIIEGQLNAQGTKENIIAFAAAEPGKNWAGIIFSNVKEKENILSFVRISGAENALSLLASSPLVEDSEFTENTVALKISGAFSQPRIKGNIIHKNRGEAVVISDGAKPDVEGNRIADNLKEGIAIQSASPTIKNNTIVRNLGSGITLHNSSAVVRENNITDNKPFDMRADAEGQSVDALNNWWGSAQGADVLARISGRINISEILSDSYPAGKTVQLPILEASLGGAIEKDSFLILSNSPYRVVKDVVVTGGATLHVEPGVVILYDQNKAITAEDGGVIARGTEKQPITFTASGASPMPGFYSTAVRFSKPTKVNSVFAYVIVKYAETGFDIHYGTPEISHSYIAYNSQTGVFCRNDAAPKISYSTFAHNMGEGAIRSVGMSKPLINYNNFSDNAFAIQAFSSIYIDGRNNWWGKNPPDDKDIFKYGEDSINIKPWLEKPEEGAFKE